MSVRAEIRTAAHAERADRADPGGRRARARAKKAEDGKDATRSKVVFVVDGGKASQRPVATGLSDETHVELTSGVKPGEQVVTGPYRILRDLQDGDAGPGQQDLGGRGPQGRQGRHGKKDEDN